MDGHGRRGFKRDRVNNRRCAGNKQRAPSPNIGIPTTAEVIGEGDNRDEEDVDGGGGQRRFSERYISRQSNHSAADDKNRDIKKNIIYAIAG